jgi:plasmid stabilization system protein ParE
VCLAIELSPEARQMLEDADERWIEEHGLLVENPLLDQVVRAMELLRDTPELGVLYRGASFRRGIRRLLLRCGWHVYYVIEPQRIVVVAVWFASRRRPSL